MKLVVFSHGKESGPNGNKIALLKTVAEKHGFIAASIDYRKCFNTLERVQILTEFIQGKEFDTLILVGSSMGGYVSTVVSDKFAVMGLFLLCPALYMDKNEYPVQTYSPECGNIEIVHGWNDRVVPYQNSIRFGEHTKAIVNLINDGHRLDDSYSLIRDRFSLFLHQICD